MPDFWLPNSGIEPQSRPNCRKYTQLHIIHYLIHRSFTPIFNLLVCIVIVYAISCMAANAFRFRLTAKSYILLCS